MKIVPSACSAWNTLLLSLPSSVLMILQWLIYFVFATNLKEKFPQYPLSELKLLKTNAERKIEIASGWRIDLLKQKMQNSGYALCQISNSPL